MEKLHFFHMEAFKNLDNYDIWRPDYTKEAAEYVAKRLFKSKMRDIAYNILELGCGTGKFTTILYQVLPTEISDVKYLATDPLKDPLSELKQKLPTMDIKLCAASNIPLPDASVENIVCAMSFHFFADEDSLKEISRVLVPGGRLMLIFEYLPYGYEFPMKLFEYIESYLDPSIPLVEKRAWKPAIASYKHLKLLEHCFVKGSKIEDPRSYAVNYGQAIGLTAFMTEEEKKTASFKLESLIEQYDSTTPFELDTEFYCVEKDVQ